MISFKTSGHLARELDKRIQQFSRSNPKATLSAPSWLRFVEWGTATKRESDPEHGITGPGSPYVIRPVNAESLRIPDAGGKLAKLGHDESGNFAFAQQVTHPGIKPHAPIRKALFQIRDSIRQIFRLHLASLGVTFTAMQSALLPAMESVKQIVTESIAREVPGSSDPEGRLEGTAAEDFAEKGQIQIIEGLGNGR